MEYRRANISQAIGEYDDALVLFKKSINIFEKYIDVNNINKPSDSDESDYLLQAYCNCLQSIAVCYLGKGDKNNGLKSALYATDKFIKYFGKQDDAYLWKLSLLSDAYADCGDYAKASIVLDEWRELETKYLEDYERKSMLFRKCAELAELQDHQQDALKYYNMANHECPVISSTIATG